MVFVPLIRIDLLGDVWMGLVYLYLFGCLVAYLTITIFAAARARDAGHAVLWAYLRAIAWPAYFTYIAIIVGPILVGIRSPLRDKWFGTDYAMIAATSFVVLLWLLVTWQLIRPSQTDTNQSSPKPAEVEP